MADHLHSLAESELSVSPPSALSNHPESTTEHPPALTTATTLTSSSSSTPTNTAVSRSKSPPLAFERTPNDSLHSLISPPLALGLESSSSSSSLLLSPSIAPMGTLGSPSANETHLQNVIHRQHTALSKFHEAFDVERTAWQEERDSLYLRIAALEQLLKTRDHHSPAKSPSVSPSLTSPPTRIAGTSQRLPSIAENEGVAPLSHRRDGAPRSIELPKSRSKAIDRSVGFASSSHAHSRVDENRSPPSQNINRLSPLISNVDGSGERVALRSTRVPTPPPQNMTLDGVEDMPTRHNTHLNAFLTQSHDDDDPALKGPLNLPELPNRPDDANFTLDALSKRLEAVASSPDESTPTIFKAPTPGVASPVDELSTQLRPSQTRSADRAHSDTGSHGKGSAALSPEGGPFSQQQSQDRRNLDDLDHGGIKLKKKPSINFGQPLGQLGGFQHRRHS